ncbi:shematrin-like protein 1 isoform X2 [Penaeus indicus]
MIQMRGFSSQNAVRLIACVLATLIQPGHSFISLSDISPALERMASYGYSMLGYGPPPSYGEDDLEIYEVDGPLWDGHIAVGDFISPIVSAVSNSDLGFGGGGGGYGDERVVKGYDGRLGVRVAVPYLGDFQVTREFGPGKFGPHLGPGKYPYPGYSKDSSGSYGYGGHASHASHGSHGSHGIPIPSLPSGKKKKKIKKLGIKALYKGLKNYPWHGRRRR